MFLADFLLKLYQSSIDIYGDINRFPNYETISSITLNFFDIHPPELINYVSKKRMTIEKLLHNKNDAIEIKNFTHKIGISELGKGYKFEDFEIVAGSELTLDKYLFDNGKAKSVNLEKDSFYCALDMGICIVFNHYGYSLPALHKMKRLIYSRPYLYLIDINSDKGRYSMFENVLSEVKHTISIFKSYLITTCIEFESFRKMYFSEAFNQYDLDYFIKASKDNGNEKYLKFKDFFANPRFWKWVILYSVLHKVTSCVISLLGEAIKKDLQNGV